MLLHEPNSPLSLNVINIGKNYEILLKKTEEAILQLLELQSISFLRDSLIISLCMWFVWYGRNTIWEQILPWSKTKTSFSITFIALCIYLSNVYKISSQFHFPQSKGSPPEYIFQVIEFDVVNTVLIRHLQFEHLMIVVLLVKNLLFSLRSLIRLIFLHFVHHGIVQSGWCGSAVNTNHTNRHFILFDL